MTATGFPTGTVTFLFTDIEGSTRLWESQPGAMRGALVAHDAILRAAIESHGGAVFKTVGDAFCAAFGSALDALRAAVDAQHALSQHSWPESIGLLRVRMGLHSGTSVESGGDYFGPTVNRVARLMSLGAGEQILVSSAASALLRDAMPPGLTLRDLGTHRLKDLSEPEPTYQVVGDGLREDFPALRSLDARPNNLPLQISSFVGRTRELGELRDALAQRRLVTIVGPGGIGKTRLALHLAADAISDYVDGAWFVSLSTVRTADLIAQLTADTLHIREQPQSSVTETVAAALAEREMLLVFDNAEHLVQATAAFAKLLLGRCARLKVLVTSREPLHLTGEHVVRLTALEDAAALFVDRAHAVMPGLRFDVPTDRAVDSICRRLDGIPLAIELAAARAATLPIAELSSRLSSGLRLLVSRDTTVEERHRTLRGTIAWSYDLLGERDAAVLRALAVFEGTFAVSAVAAITGASEEDQVDVLDALVGKSLVSIVSSGSTARYNLMDTVREYLLEVTEGAVVEQLRARHFDYYERFAPAMTSQVRTGDIAAWLDSIATETSNVRSALQWGLVHHPSRAAALLRDLSRYLKIRGHLTEGRNLFRRFLEAPGIEDAGRAALLRRAATFATEQDDYDEARALTAESQALYERLGDVGGVAEAMHNLAVIEQRGGHADLAATQYGLAIVKFREAKNDYGKTVALVNLAMLAFSRNDHDEAEKCVEEAAFAGTQVDDADLAGHILALRGELALRRGDNEAAAGYFRQSIAIMRALGNVLGLADAENSLAMASIREGRVADAVASARETLRIAIELDVSSLVIFGFEAFCEIAMYESRHENAAIYYGLAMQLRETHEYRKPAGRALDEFEGVLRAQLGERFEAIVADCANTDWRKTAAELALREPG